MKLLARLTIILALCLITFGLFSTPVQAVCRYPDIRLSANEGFPGDSITIYGKDLDPDAYVDIYYYLDSSNRVHLKEFFPNSTRDFSVTVTVPESPAGARTVRAIGRVDGVPVQLDATFRVMPVVLVSPAHGPIGTEVRVSGRGFAANETGIEVRYYPDRFMGLYDTVAAGIRADARGSWDIAFRVPVSARGEHYIGARGSVHVLVQGVRPAVFRIGPGITIGATSGAVGQTIAVIGTGFEANERNIRIVIDGKAVSTTPSNITADATGRWNAAFTVPEMPAGDYDVTARGDTTQQRDVDAVSFEIRPALALSPDEGHVDISVTATGLGFPVAKRVAILYGGDEVADAIVDYEGSFEAVFEVPESRFGPQDVVAAIKEEPNSVSNLKPVATAVFIMESNHPAAPLPESPGDGRSIGFFRRATPTFEWEEVFDLSGVYYSIRVATSPDFEPESILVSKTGLTGTSYTAEEPLTNGTYYWTVRAVDGAQNESGWTDAQRLRVGRLPMWGFIAIFAFVGLLLGLRAYFILVRPKLYE